MHFPLQITGKTLANEAIFWQINYLIINCSSQKSGNGVLRFFMAEKMEKLRLKWSEWYLFYSEFSILLHGTLKILKGPLVPALSLLGSTWAKCCQCKACNEIVSILLLTWILLLFLDDSLITMVCGYSLCTGSRWYKKSRVQPTIIRIKSLIIGVEAQEQVLLWCCYKNGQLNHCD